MTEFVVWFVFWGDLYFIFCVSEHFRAVGFSCYESVTPVTNSLQDGKHSPRPTNRSLSPAPLSYCCSDSSRSYSYYDNSGGFTTRSYLSYFLNNRSFIIDISKITPLFTHS